MENFFYETRSKLHKNPELALEVNNGDNSKFYFNIHSENEDNDSVTIENE